MGKTDWGGNGSCPDGRGCAQYIFNPIFCWRVGLCFSLLFYLIPTYGRGNEDNGDLLRKVPLRHCYTQCPQPCNRPPPTHASTRNSWTPTGKSVSCLVGHCSFLLGPGAHKVLFVLSKSLFSQLFWWLYAEVNGDLLQEGLCHSQVYCTQRPCPHSCPLLTHTSSGDTQAQFCLSLCGVSGSWCAQGMFEPSECLWQGGWGLIPTMILPLVPSC